MSKRLFTRAAASVAAVATIAVGGFIAVSPAQAAHIGGATLSPATGNALSTISVTTGGPCPVAATQVRARVFGFGFPANGQIVVGTTSLGFSTTDPMTLPLSNTFKAYATNNGATILNGAYELRVECLDPALVVVDDYRNAMNWTTPGNSFANINSASYTSQAVQPTFSTTTALTAVPNGGTVTEATQIDLTATIAAGTNPTPNVGSVEFFAGATSLGTAPVAAGVATLNDALLPEGASVSVTAAYTGVAATSTVAGYGNSVSSAVNFQVDPVVIPTTTSLAVTGTLKQFAPTTLTATIVPNNAPGTVIFKDGTTTLNTSPKSSGSATVSFTTSSLSLGAHSLTAEFVPAVPTDYSGSTSPAQNITIAVADVPTDGQEVIVDVPLGVLTIAVSQDKSVLLEPTVEDDGIRYTDTSVMDDVTVVDLRAGSKGWTANGQLGVFTKQNAAAPGRAVSNTDIGWAPVVRNTSGTQTATAGPSVAPAYAAANAGNGFTPAGNGLADERVLAASPAGSSTGTAVLGAVLSIDSDTDIAPGLHTATLTFTAI